MGIYGGAIQSIQLVDVINARHCIGIIRRFKMMDSFSFLIAAGLFTLFIGFAVGFWSATLYKLNKFADKIKDVSDKHG